MRNGLAVFLFISFLYFCMLPGCAQQVMYSSLKTLKARQGDTVSVLRVEKRTKKQIYLMGGNDYRIEAIENPGLSKYLRARCYAVSVDTALYLNCRKIKYQRYRLGNWYASAFYMGGRVFFCAQPVGQEATRTLHLPTDQKLGGNVGDAINASGMVERRVYYELDLESGRALFVGKDYLSARLSGKTHILRALAKEPSEDAALMYKYIRLLPPVSL